MSGTIVTTRTQVKYKGRYIGKIIKGKIWWVAYTTKDSGPVTVMMRFRSRSKQECLDWLKSESGKGYMT